MPQPVPHYTDGLQAVTDLSVFCYNNSSTYLCYDGDPGEEATQKEFTDSNMQPLGSDTETGFRKGSLNLQYTLAADELQTDADQMRPGFILSFRGRYFVTGPVKPKIVKNDVIKFSVAVLELQNPFIGNLLSTTYGQQKVANINANIATTVNCAALNNRVGGPVTYNVETYGTPGSSPPSGVSIAANGLLTVNVAAGTIDVLVKATDTLTGQNTNVGWGRYTATAA